MTTIRIFDDEIGLLLAALGSYELLLDSRHGLEGGAGREEEQSRIERIRERVHSADALELAGFTDGE